jgi:hypothetical protein
MPYKDNAVRRAVYALRSPESRERQRLSSIAWKASRRANGGCQGCKERPANPGRSLCQPCKERQYETYHALSIRRAKTMLDGCMQRAKADGVQCTLTLDWIMERFARGVCELTRIPFATGKWPGARANPYGPSIDRTQVGGDYSPDNCRLIICALNLGINDWGTEVYKIVAQAYLARN